MAQKYNSRDGEGIFDIGVKLNVGLENIVQFARDNNLSSLTDTIATNTQIIYTPEVSVSVVEPMNNALPETLQYLSRERQSIFDIGIMLGGGMENIVSFSMSNSIQSLTAAIPTRSFFAYSGANLAVTNWIKSNGYIFSTQPNIISSELIPLSFTLRSLFVGGHSWRFTCDDTGMISNPGEDLGIVAGFDTEFILQDFIGNSWRFFVDDTGELNSVSLGVLAGQATEKIIRSIGPDAHKWSFAVDTTGMISQPGTDLGL
jgi:hypothetical protein